MIRRVCGPLHVAVVAFWLCAVVCVAATAAVVFPMMKGLDPTLSTYSAYTGPHWMLTAGHVGARLFRALDLAAAVGLPLVVLTAVGGRYATDRSRTVIARWALIGFLCVLAAYQLGVLHPAMFRELKVYWDAAKSGDNETAEAHRALFSAMHPNSTRLLGAEALVLLGLLVMSVWTTARAIPAGRGAGAA